MDFDLPQSLRETVAHAVFGGPTPDTAVLLKVFKANKLDWPVMVVATHQWRPGGMAVPAGVRLLQLHAGLTYVLTNRSGDALRRKLESLKLMHGSIEPAAGPGQLFFAIQQSILSLRRHEIRALDQPVPQRSHQPRARRSKPTWQAERDLQSLLAGQILRHDPHWPSTAQVWVQMVLHRHPGHLNEVRRKIAQLISELGQLVDQSPLFSYTFSTAMEQLYRTHAYSDFPQMVINSLGDMQLHLPGQAMLQKHQPAVVVMAMAYLQEHFQMQISLRDVAEHVGVSAPHLARQFRQSTGQNVSAWLHRLRVIRACQLLSESEQTVLQIALSCGFGAVEHFHRVFKNLTGYTPHRYRQTHQRRQTDQNKS